MKSRGYGTFLIVTVLLVVSGLGTAFTDRAEALAISDVSVTGNQVFNLIVTVLALVGCVTTLVLVGAWLNGTSCGCFE